MNDTNLQYLVSLKLPIFWISQPAVWFEQAEAQFHYYLVGSLDQGTARRIIDFLQQPPALDRYGAIKTLLIHTSGPSCCERAAQLLHMGGPGDWFPSTLMNDMLALMDGHTPCLLFEQIFLEQMSKDICLLLADDNFGDNFRKLAARAKVLWHAKQCGGATIYLVAASRQSARFFLTPERRAVPSTVRESPDKERSCYYHQR